ncbi:MAG: nucleotidyltransferase domain-containing protein, partial [Bacteroidetes bacterium]|nr:nucleotidyltransferase domain-containing protein [Bacteroidota bacterium]
MTDSKQILNYLRLNKDRYQREYHLTRIGIFGSVARGEQTDKSDIDLIVEFEDGTENLFEIKQELISELQSRFKMPVDICREKY